MTGDPSDLLEVKDAIAIAVEFNSKNWIILYYNRPYPDSASIDRFMPIALPEEKARNGVPFALLFRQKHRQNNRSTGPMVVRKSLPHTEIAFRTVESSEKTLSSNLDS
ncbi:hypothetical protein QPK87_36825 [Kamptonema cortianum]|nr:hypothetical protein [Geitlerinema splendidum]MDK3162073.1 hypothetical protein [Kamptonema cortianum]MDL5047570.1 hypothetical protein [Oscillatoria amoena NRMC-F 0135]